MKGILKTIVLIILCLLAISLFSAIRAIQPVKKYTQVSSPFLKKEPEPLPKPILESLFWQEIKNIPWGKRDSHTVFIFDEKIWITGGLNSNESRDAKGMPAYEGAIYYNDIWNSTDGVDWNRVTQNAEYPKIRSTSIIYFKDSLYMMGGWSPETGAQNAVWKSTDGIKWNKVSTSTPWQAREGQDVFEFNGKLWLVGGVDYYAGKTFNDVRSRSSLKNQYRHMVAGSSRLTLRVTTFVLVPLIRTSKRPTTGPTDG